MCDNDIQLYQEKKQILSVTLNWKYYDPITWKMKNVTAEDLEIIICRCKRVCSNQSNAYLISESSTPWIVVYVIDRKVATGYRQNGIYLPHRLAKWVLTKWVAAKWVSFDAFNNFLSNDVIMSHRHEDVQRCFNFNYRRNDNCYNNKNGLILFSSIKYLTPSFSPFTSQLSNDNE